MFRPRPQERLDHGLYLASDRDILRIIQLAAPCERLMIIGHNPGLAELAVGLTGRGNPELVERLLESFPTSAAAVFSFEAPLSQARDLDGRLDHVLTAKALRPPL
jgi:phosphohistidine phosphatase